MPRQPILPRLAEDDTIDAALPKLATATAADGAMVLELLQAQLDVGDWPGAEATASVALKLGLTDARLALGEALAGQGKYREALAAVLPHAAALGAKLGTRVAQWARNVKESQQGKYDWFTLMACSTANPEARFEEVAEYQGPIEVVDVEGKGKGVRATKAIKRGTLLCVSRAAGIVFPVNGRFLDSLPDGVLEDLRRRLLRRRYLRAQVLDLARGTHAAELERVPHSEATAYAAIIATNAYTAVELTSLSAQLSDHIGAGLWVLPSRFNHACTSQVIMSHIGDLAVLHAGCDIAAGEEIFTRYEGKLRTPPRLAGIDRPLPLNPYERWGFDCQCEWCCYVKDFPALPSAGPDWRACILAPGPAEAPLQALLRRLQTDPEHASEEDLAEGRALVTRISKDLETLPVWCGHYALPLLSLVSMAHKLQWRFMQGLPAAEAAAAVASSRAFCSEPFHHHTALLCKAFMQMMAGDKANGQATFEAAVADFELLWPGAGPAFTELYPSALEVAQAFNADAATLARARG